MADASAAAFATPEEINRQVARSRRSEMRKGLLLLAPALIFLFFTFLLPLGYIFRLSVYDPTIHDGLPRTVEALRTWNGNDPPDEQTFQALADDLIDARKADTVGSIANRLNVEAAGLRSAVTKTARRLGSKPPADHYSEWFQQADPVWAEQKTWQAINQLRSSVSANYYLAAVDLRRDASGSVELAPEENRIHTTLFARTFLVAFSVTALCILLGYPVAYLIATSSKVVGSIMIVLVLLPFWTSLLVRTTGWIVLLQSQGVLNDMLVYLGIISDANRVRMIYNLAGTLIAMTHILLPFFILPLYSVMVSISPIYMRAAQSLGAHRFYAFWKVYFPNTLPGVGSGALLAFILAVGYYITPALVGGQSGQMISNMIAFHVQSSLDWGLAAALGMILLSVVLVLYAIYHRYSGANRLVN
ncbi:MULTISPECIES: ABC transporter permease [unclassified Rhizobium]|uniref:ABC transporter permease n=1 Tax=unclassified Rhizobium TaxID=2613769 RepID=UPI000EA9ED17|nr:MULTISPECIES: ABC transporter permease [unclassified Rhizobium]AYG70858.1 ABC transporter permease [Rhizobium sp. CCGE531]AYG77173.1 ABC transporter permease [Rhizobium sp. CCGE532]